MVSRANGDGHEVFMCRRGLCWTICAVEVDTAPSSAKIHLRVFVISAVRIPLQRVVDNSRSEV